MHEMDSITCVDSGDDGMYKGKYGQAIYNANKIANMR